MQPILLAWVGGEHDFALPIGALRSLQDVRDCGPEELFNRFRTGAWRSDDAIQTLRWGLVGGGSMTPSEAAQFVTPLFDLHPLMTFKLPCLKVMHHALFGPEDDPAGEAQGVTVTAPENGAFQSSTETGQ